MSIDLYRKTMSVTDAPHQAEFRAFAHVIHALRSAENGDSLVRNRALYDTHKLWTVLVSDLADPGNNLPTTLKAELISIGAWACKYSLTAMSTDLPLEPLIAVNTNIAQGLSDQMARRAGREASSAAATTPMPAHAAGADQGGRLAAQG